jgi:hypothetical protein
LSLEDSTCLIIFDYLAGLLFLDEASASIHLQLLRKSSPHTVIKAAGGTAPADIQQRQMVAFPARR